MTSVGGTRWWMKSLKNKTTLCGRWPTWKKNFAAVPFLVLGVMLWWQFWSAPPADFPDPPPPEPPQPGESPLIPHILVFTYQDNLLKNPKRHVSFHANIMNTIQMYRKLWEEPQAPVWFLDDADCRQAIGEVEPRLVSFFNKESRGGFKADICRAAALYLRGGYYFDVDIEVIRPFSLTTYPEISFVTAVSPHNSDTFFQAVLFAEPKNEPMRLSMNFMLQYYLKNYTLLHNLLGPTALRSAFDVYPKYKDKSHLQNHVLLLYETLLTDHRELFPRLPRQTGIGPYCNFVVHDNKQPYFYSRKQGITHNC